MKLSKLQKLISGSQLEALADRLITEESLKVLLRFGAILTLPLNPDLIKSYLEFSPFCTLFQNCFIDDPTEPDENGYFHYDSSGWNENGLDMEIICRQGEDPEIVEINVWYNDSTDTNKQFIIGK